MAEGKELGSNALWVALWGAAAGCGTLRPAQFARRRPKVSASHSGAPCGCGSRSQGIRSPPAARGPPPRQIGQDAGPIHYCPCPILRPVTTSWAIRKIVRKHRWHRYSGPAQHRLPGRSNLLRLMGQPDTYPGRRSKEGTPSGTTWKGCLSMVKIAACALNVLGSSSVPTLIIIESGRAGVLVPIPVPQVGQKYRVTGLARSLRAKVFGSPLVKLKPVSGNMVIAFG